MAVAIVVAACGGGGSGGSGSEGANSAADADAAVTSGDSSGEASGGAIECSEDRNGALNDAYIEIGGGSLEWFVSANPDLCSIFGGGGEVAFTVATPEVMDQFDPATFVPLDDRLPGFSFDPTTFGAFYNSADNTIINVGTPPKPSSGDEAADAENELRENTIMLAAYFGLDRAWLADEIPAGAEGFGERYASDLQERVAAADADQETDEPDSGDTEPTAFEVDPDGDAECPFIATADVLAITGAEGIDSGSFGPDPTENDRYYLCEWTSDLLGDSVAMAVDKQAIFGDPTSDIDLVREAWQANLSDPEDVAGDSLDFYKRHLGAAGDWPILWVADKAGTNSLFGEVIYHARGEWDINEMPEATGERPVFFSEIFFTWFTAADGEDDATNDAIAISLLEAADASYLPDLEG